MGPSESQSLVSPFDKKNPISSGLNKDLSLEPVCTHPLLSFTMDHPEHLLVSSALGWFREPPRSQEVVRHIHNLLDEEFSPLGLTPRQMFRHDQLLTVRSKGREIPAAAERLIRWDAELPSKIFHVGMKPRVKPDSGRFPRGPFKLYEYVLDHLNNPSIFVSTTQPYRILNAATGKTRIYHWTPRDTVDPEVDPNNPEVVLGDSRTVVFEYEIFAYGGIDVNRVLGNHVFDNQHEIAFPGGIRREFIRAAREHIAIVKVTTNPDGEREAIETSYTAKIHRNRSFNPRMNPRDHVPGRHLPPHWLVKGYNEEPEVPMF